MPQANSFYIRHPALQGEKIVFVYDDALWRFSPGGGPAERLAGGLASPARPQIGPGGQVAFTALAGGKAEVFLADESGARQLTFLGATVKTIGWHDGHILVSTNARQPFNLSFRLAAVDPATGEAELLPPGPVASLSFGPAGRRVLSRFELFEYSARKRYRGGNRGDLWIEEASGAFTPLLRIEGNVARPQWIGERIYFLSDFEGHGNLYSCDTSGADLRPHTFHRGHYARHLTGDGKNLVFTHAGDLHFFDVAAGREEKLSPPLPGPAPRKKTFCPARHVDSYDVRGDAVAIAARGRVFRRESGSRAFEVAGGTGEAPVRLVRWTSDGKLLTAGPVGGEDRLQLISGETRELCGATGLGRITDLAASQRHAAVVNHRNEVTLCDLTTGAVTTVFRSRHGEILGCAFSPDGKWLAFGAYRTPEVSTIRLYDVESGRLTEATSPYYRDHSPAFDASGRFLYFISTRFPRAAEDVQSKELVVSRSEQLCALSLCRETPLLTALPEAERTARGDGLVDPEGMDRRLCVLPADAGRYSQLAASGDALYVIGTNGQAADSLFRFTLRDFRFEPVAPAVSFRADPRGGLAYLSGAALLHLGEGQEPVGEDSALPASAACLENEWREIFEDAWRSQRDFFWRAEGPPGWEEVRERFGALLPRCASRAELSDLIWELQGELATSHAFEQYQEPVDQPPSQGFLGAELRKTENGRYEICPVPAGREWDPEASSPLARHGAAPEEGEALVAIDGVSLLKRTPASLLAGKGGREVELTLGKAVGPPRKLKVNALRAEQPLLYQAWLRRTRERVAGLSHGRVAYVPVPSFGPKDYLELSRELALHHGSGALVLDARYCTGGNLSDQVLAKLRQSQLGVSRGRWTESRAYPALSAPPSLVLLINEFTCSDGEVFAEAFRGLGLGPLVGKRTWGGTVGFSGRTRLLDGGSVTQPQVAHWLESAGWGLENQGVKPDVEAETLPGDYATGADPQLERAVELALAHSKTPSLPRD